MRYGIYDYRTYSEILPTVDDYLELWAVNRLPKVMTESEMTTIYFMLLARYANSPIASCDEGQFINQLFLTIFEYAPTWSKKLEIQNRLRELTAEEIKQGGKAVSNHAYNPSTAPIASSTEALPKIDQQNFTSYLKSEMEGMAVLAALLDQDITNDFLDKFGKLFNPWALPNNSAYYCSEV